jgi:cyclopropane-fatty-acyl-phospholipid synthase
VSCPLPTANVLADHGRAVGFTVPKSKSLRNLYMKTPGLWADALESNKQAAIVVTDETNYQRYLRYLQGCQNYFIEEAIDVSLVTYLKPAAAA